MEIDAFIEIYPRLYHMAQAGSWPSIQANGLLSTRAVLDCFSITGDSRLDLEERHRPESVVITDPKFGTVVLRDQKPMPPNRLAKALNDGTSPEDWYRFLNSRVFLWAQEARVEGLLSARSYRGTEHDVLTVDTASLLAAHRNKVLLCHMNSGNTFPYPHQRGMSIFKEIETYETRKDGTPLKPVAEVTFDYAIPDIANFVIDVNRRSGKS